MTGLDAHRRALTACTVYSTRKECSGVSLFNAQPGWLRHRGSGEVHGGGREGVVVTGSRLSAGLATVLLELLVEFIILVKQDSKDDAVERMSAFMSVLFLFCFLLVRNTFSCLRGRGVLHWGVPTALGRTLYTAAYPFLHCGVPRTPRPTPPCTVAYPPTPALWLTPLLHCGASLFFRPSTFY